MTRKHEVIVNLVELSRWRKQLKYAIKKVREDAPLGERMKAVPLALDAIDNGFANLTAAISAVIKPKARKPRKML